MKKKIILALFVVMSNPGFTQSIGSKLSEKMLDSLKFSYFQLAALKYPSIRQASLSTDYVSNAEVHSKLLGNELFDAKAQIVRTRAHFTMPVSSWGKNIVSATFGLTNEYVNLSHVKNQNSLLDIRNMKKNFTTFSFSGSYTRSDSLFNRPVAYSISVSGMTNAYLNRMRISGIGFASITLIRNPVTSLSLGAVLIADRSSVVPAYLLVSYSRKFASLGLELLADIPSRVVVRKELTPKSFVSLGSELTGSLFFFDVKAPGLPSNAISTTLIIKSGITYERVISKNIILGMSGGILSSPMIKALNSRGTSDHFIKSKSTSEPFLNVTLSVLPFWRGLRL